MGNGLAKRPQGLVTPGLPDTDGSQTIAGPQGSVTPGLPDTDGSQTISGPQGLVTPGLPDTDGSQTLAWPQGLATTGSDCSQTHARPQGWVHWQLDWPKSSIASPAILQPAGLQVRLFFSQLDCNYVHSSASSIAIPSILQPVRFPGGQSFFEQGESDGAGAPSKQWHLHLYRGSW
jgi:hypothetical protein